MKSNKRLFVLIIFWGIYFNLFAHQLSNPIDSGEVYRTIRNSYDGVLPESFFVIISKTSLSSNTNAPAIIKEYQIIQMFKDCKNVLVIFKDDALIGENHLDSYFKSRYFLDTTVYQKTKIIVDDALVDELCPDFTLAELLYVHNGKLWYRETCKYGSVKDKELPYSPVTIKFDEKIQLDTRQAPHTLSNYYRWLNDSILVQVSEYNSRVSLLNCNTGKIQKSLYPSAVSATDVFEKLVAKDEKEILVAKKLEMLLKSQNRQTVSFEAPFIAEENIYLTGDIQVMIKLRQDYQYFDEEKKTQRVEKGSLFGMDFPILVKCNLDLEVEDIYYLGDEAFPNREDNFLEVRPNFGCFIEDDIVHSFNYPKYNPRNHKLRKRKKASYAVSEFSIEKQKGEFISFKSVPFIRGLADKDEAFQSSHFFKWNQRLYFNYDISHKIYDVESGDRAFSLFDDGSYFDEYYRRNTFDTTQNQIRHRILSQGPILDNKYFAFVFFFKEQLYLEVFNRQNRSIQLVPLYTLPGMENVDIAFDAENFIISPNGIMFMYDENRRLFFNKYTFLTKGSQRNIQLGRE